VLRSVYSRPRSRGTIERIVEFGLPVLEHIDSHRRVAGPSMKREGRVIMHEHLADVLTNLIADELAMIPRALQSPISMDLVARHIASTFVLVLNWWVESNGASTAAVADERFRSLVVPVLRVLSQVG